MKAYTNYAEDGSTQQVGMMLDNYFVTNLHLAYNFKMKKMGIKDATVGVTLYNLFSAKYDNNGWAGPGYKKDNNGQVMAYVMNDLTVAGFAPSAPFNFMVNLSLNF